MVERGDGERFVGAWLRFSFLFGDISTMRFSYCYSSEMDVVSSLDIKLLIAHNIILIAIDVIVCLLLLSRKY